MGFIISNYNWWGYHVALELLCSISNFADFQKRGDKVVNLHIAWFYFCILTAGFKVHSYFCVVIDFFVECPVLPA